jgi:hypothetical protein
LLLYLLTLAFGAFNLEFLVFRDAQHERELVPTPLALIFIDRHDLTSVDLMGVSP